MKRILIVSATAGEGHKAAALAIKGSFDIINPPDYEIKIIDALEYTNSFFKWFYPRVYIFAVTYIPSIWGFSYYLYDLKWLHPVVSAVRRLHNKINTIRLEKFLCEFKPEIVITTHFLTSEVV